MIPRKQSLLSQLGFRFGSNGSHAARTMMLDELRTLMGHTDPEATQEDYRHAIVEQNVLGKPTLKSRQLTFRHLVSLYGLDAARNPLFRALRRLWHLNEYAQPLMALAMALARDPLLKTTESLILSKPIGVPVGRDEVERCLDKAHPDRFSPASLKSFAQNVGGSWTAAGFLQGRLRKVRSQPAIYPEAVIFLLLLAYLEGRSGQRLFSSSWVRLTGCTSDELIAYTQSAAHRGLMVFLNAGGVQEVRFPGFLKPEEESVHRELLHVV